MCGIMGYTGHRQAMPIVLDGLSRIEYRGYDSAGIAILGPGGVFGTTKAVGKLDALRADLEGSFVSGTLGLGHTRWATHGAPSLANAHPHMDCTGRVSVVQNGIVENYSTLAAQLTSRGHKFTSRRTLKYCPTSSKRRWIVVSIPSTPSHRYCRICTARWSFWWPARRSRTH